MGQLTSGRAGLLPLIYSAAFAGDDLQEVWPDKLRALGDERSNDEVAPFGPLETQRVSPGFDSTGRKVALPLADADEELRPNAHESGEVGPREAPHCQCVIKCAPEVHKQRAYQALRGFQLRLVK